MYSNVEHLHTQAPAGRQVYNFSFYLTDDDSPCRISNTKISTHPSSQQLGKIQKAAAPALKTARMSPAAPAPHDQY